MFRSHSGRVAPLVAMLLLVAGLLTACQSEPITLQGTLLVNGGSAAPAGVAVTAYADSEAIQVAQTFTDGSGHYVFRSGGLPAGTYRIRFGDGSWWQEASTWAGAAPVLASDNPPTQLDASIQTPSGAITGTVTTRKGKPVAGATVTAFTADGSRSIATTLTAGDGTYHLDGLSAMQLAVHFNAPGLAEQWYGGVAIPGEATSVESDGTSVAPGVDAVLASESQLSGTVWGAPGNLDGLLIVAYEKPSGLPIASTVTTTNGAFTIHGLPAGTYSVGFIDLTGRFRSEVSGTISGDPTAGSVYAVAEGKNSSVGLLKLHGIDCPLDAAQANLSGHDFHGANLISCDFTSTNLTGADLSGANLYGANFPSAYLNAANLTGANLDHAFLFNTDAGGATFTGASTNGTIFSGSNLQGADFGGTPLGRVTSGRLVGQPIGLGAGWSVDRGYLIGPSANLNGADLNGLDFSGRDLSSADLSNADVRGATFTAANLRNTSFVNTKFAGAILTDTDLAKATLRGVSSGGIVGVPSTLPAGWVLFSGTLFGERAVVTGATIQGADLSSANLLGVVSGGLTGIPTAIPAHWALTHGTLIGLAATVTGANIDGVDLSDVNLKGVTSGGLTGAPVAMPTGWVFYNGYFIGRGAELGRAQLGGLHAPAIDLAGTNLSSADLSGADLTGANLAGVQLGLVNLSTADLTGADLTGANIYGADLDGTTLADTILANIYSGALHGTPVSLPPGRPIYNSYLLCPGADIAYADLTGADLTGLDLSGAHLMMAILNSVDLTNTDLSGAVLTGASLTNNVVAGTDFSDAILTDTFSGALTGTPAALPVGWTLVSGVLMPPDD